MISTSVVTSFIVLAVLTFSTKCLSEDGIFETNLVTIDNNEFTFHKQRLSWNEASSLCRSLGGYIAIVNSLSLANNLIEVTNKLSNHKEYHNVWIGGRYKNGKWIWKPTGDEFRSSNGFPPWKNTTITKHTSCLLFHFNKNSTLQFLNQECGHKHPFICERSLEVRVSVEAELEDSGHRYSFYRAPVVWDEAVTMCRENGSYLAVISDLREAKLLSSFLAYSPLNLKKVWVGGRLDTGAWTWLGTGDTIPSNIQADGYPPWEEKYVLDPFLQQCLQLSGENALQPLFQVANCTSLQGFACEQVLSKQSEERYNFSHHGQEYFILNRKLSWESAIQACQAENAQLASVEDLATAKLVASGMRNTWESVSSLWVGGHQSSDNVWKWLSSTAELDSKKNPATGYPPWNNNSSRRAGDCLSFERLAGEDVEFLKKPREICQEFLCQRDESAVSPVVLEVVIGDRNFTIHEQPETWGRAIDICKQENSHLAVLRDVDEVYFLNNKNSVRRMWLGGHHVQGVWQWLQLGENISMELDEEGFPPWSPAARHPKHKNHCLQLDMHKPNDMRFMASACNASLGYLCEKILKTQDKRTFNGRAYIVYNVLVTWNEAAAICRSKGYHLAMASDLLESRFLASLTREYYELWLGGILRGGIWEWEHTGEEIPSTPERNGYPPWISVPTLPNHNCLSINRGAAGAPVFVDTQCGTSQRFICEAGNADISFSLEPRAVEYESRVYTFYPQRLTWAEAAEECQEAGGSLVTLINTDMTKFIAQESHNTPDVWLGGHIVDDEWQWMSSREVIPPRKEGREFPPWARLNHRPGHDCLILNTHNPNRSILVDLPCNSTQPFVCEKADGNVEKLIEIIQLSDRELIFIENQTNFTNAMDVCHQYNGYLATIDSQELVKVADAHGKKFGGVWVGAQMDSKATLRWLHTGQPLSDIGMRSMMMWDEDEEISLGNDYRTNERVLGILADIPDFISGMPKRNRGTAAMSHSETDADLNSLAHDNVQNIFLNEKIVPDSKQFSMQNISLQSRMSYAPTTQFTDMSDTLAQNRELSGVVEQIQERSMDLLAVDTEERMKRLSTTEKVFQETVIKEPTLDPTSSQISVDEQKEGGIVAKLEPTQYNTTSLQPTSQMSSSAMVTPGKDDVHTISPGDDLEYDSSLTTTEEDNKVYTTTLSPADVPATTCMKLDIKGELLETSCATMHSFVCERRTNETQAIVKYFSYRGRLFGFSTQKVNWEKAANICKNNNSYLAIITSKDMASFIANVSREFQDFWVGGRYNEEEKQWHWVHTGVNISTTQDEEGFPKWYNDPPRPRHNCLNVYREGFGEAVFVDRSCNALHGFVCEDVTLMTDDGETLSEAKSVAYEFNGRSLLLYYDRVTWDEATEYCVSNGSLLATVQTQPELEFFSTISPVFHDIWVGARVRGSNWYWDHLNSLITNVAVDGDGFTRLQKENSSIGAPLSAWMNNITRQEHQCASIYRDIDHNAHLVDHPCNALHSFACEETKGRARFLTFRDLDREGEHDRALYWQLFEIETSKVEFEGRQYVFHVQRLNWYEANEFCSQQGQYLAILNHPGEARFIADVGRAFREVWVGGRMANENNVGWVWEHTGQGILPDLGSDRFWPWLNSQPQSQSDNQCLSVFRPEGRSEMFADEDCSRSLSFVCEDADINSLPLVETIYIQNRPYTFHATLSTWEEANEACQASGSYLALINALEEAEFIAQNTHGFHDVWIGGRWNPNISRWEWCHTGQIHPTDARSEQIPIGATIAKRADHDCLNIYRDSFQQYMFIDRKCNERHSFVCEEAGSMDRTHTKKYKYENKRYTGYTKPVTWYEASDVCLSNGQNLAIVSSPAFSDFIAHNFSNEFHDLWIDGFYDGSQWKWVNKGKIIPSKLKDGANRDPSHWIHTPTRNGYNCLNLYRPSVNKTRFLDRKCNDTFGFICENVLSPVNRIETFEMAGRQYTFYSMKVDWNKANNICQSNGTYLAVVKTLQEAELITKAGRDFFNLWVGGRATCNGRTWDHTGELIANVSEKYPNFQSSKSKLKFGCVYIGLGADSKPYLNDTHCNTTLGFVCEEQGDKGETHVDVYTFNNQEYTVSTKKATWSQAEQFCQRNGSHLLVISTKEESDFFNTVSRRYHDLWIGGRQRNGIWLWTYTNKNISSGKDFPSGTYEPQIVDDITSKEDGCLILYRETNTESYLVQKSCKREYGFICEGKSIGTAPVSQSVDFNGRKYSLHTQLVNWHDALESCASRGGYLANVEDLEEAKNIIGVDKQLHDLWIGGHIYEDRWVWSHTSQPIPLEINITTLYPLWITTPTRTGYDCLNLHTSNLDPKFVDRKCTELHGFVCEEVGLKNDVKVISKFSGHRYVFVAKRVKWPVALESCRSMRGYLAVISDVKELRFLVDVSRDFHDLWIGGHLVKDKWEWHHTHGNIVMPPMESNSSNISTHEQMLPWLRFPTSPEHECLNIYRDNNNKPFLVDRKCIELHSYVCEEVPETVLSSRQVKYFRNRRYEFSQDHVGWDEADHLCRMLGGYLAITDNAEEALFLASGNKDVSNPWIGAVYEHNDTWCWKHTGEKLPTVPPFVNPIPRPHHECANLYHDGFSKLMLVDRRCGHKFSYVCEDTNEPELTVELFVYKDRRYTFSSKGATWEEALRTCSQNGSYLAIVESLEEALFLLNVSKNFHDVWIDGWFHNNVWEWKHTGQTIPPKSDKPYPPWLRYPTRPQHDCLNIYRDSNDAPHFVDRRCSEQHAFVCEEVDEPRPNKNYQLKLQHDGRSYTFSSQRVTWDEASEACKLAGSYLAAIGDQNETLFIARGSRDHHDLWVGGRLDQENWEWDHTGQIIPEEVGPNSFPPWAHNKTRPDHDCLNIFRGDGSEALFIDRRCNETHGFVCEEGDNLKGDGDAVEIKTLDDNLFIFHSQRVTWNEAFRICAENDSTLHIVNSKEVAVFLTSVGHVYHDIWLGGRVQDSDWVWKPKNRRISTSPGFPSWIRNSTRLEHDCLNLYRDNYGHPYFVDRYCEEKHVFVCQKYNTVGEKTEYLEYGDREFTFVKRPEEWGDAHDICNQNDSYLPMVTDESTQRYLVEKTASVPDIWIGGHKSKDHWLWELVGEPISAVGTNKSLPLWESEQGNSSLECLALGTETNKFAALECISLKPFVCEKGCPPLRTVKRGKWSRPECSSRVARRNETCSLKCNFGFELWGSQHLTCSSGGWNGVPASCVTTDRMANAFVERVNASLNEMADLGKENKSLHMTLLFVVCTTKSLGSDNFFSIIELIKSLTAAVRLSPGIVSAGVITYGSKGKVNIPFNTSDTCNFLELANLLADNSDDETDFRGALNFVEDHITQQQQPTVIVLVTNGNSSTDSNHVQLKTEGHKILTVGIGAGIKSEQLEEIASSAEPVKTANFFILSDDDTFSNFVSYLNDTYLYNGDIECCMSLRKPVHGEWNSQTCSKTPGVVNGSCSVTCELGYELVGNPRLTCTEEGWIGLLGKGQVPSCNSAEVTARSMFDSMDETFTKLDKIGILFLLDHSTSMSAADYQKQMSFVRMIVNKFSLSESRTAGLITFNTQAQVMIPLYTSETCAFIMGLEDVKFQGGGTSFSVALQAAENEINAHGIHSTTLLFLMTDGRSPGNAKVIANRLKSDGNLIFTLGIGGYKRKQLESLASRGPNNKPTFFSITDFDALQNAISFLNASYLQSSEKHCCTRLRSHIAGSWQPSTCSSFPSGEHEECSITCDIGFELFGSDKLLCADEGWHGIAPSCFAKADVMANLILDHLYSLMKNAKKPKALLFALEQTEKMTRDQFTIMVDFVKQLVTMFPLSANLTGGLIVGLKTVADTEVTLDTDSTCNFFKQQEHLKFHTGSPSLGRILKLVKKSTKAYGVNENTVVVLLTNRKYVSKTSLSLALKVKESGKDIFIIGLDNRIARGDLLIMSENVGNATKSVIPNNLMILDSFDTLEAITEQLSMPEKLVSWYERTGYVIPKC